MISGPRGAKANQGCEARHEVFKRVGTGLVLR